ncbi:DUF6221 family protein [Streptomyces sp. NPDC007251]|uniref:DUF6221 family protein n=1 Tax=Streptomyces sp. NPDC007251 TaxID=3154483 RepID=UPI0033F79B1E
MTKDLVQWLLAQLDEDEQIARAAGGRSEQAWAADLSGKDPAGLPSWPVVVRYVTDGRLRGAVANLPVTNERSEDRMVHIATHDPARVLREIGGKRRLIARGGPFCTSDCDEPGNEPMDPDTNWTTPLEHHLDCAAYEAAKLMALPYADRPDYDEAWRP